MSKDTMSVAYSFFRPSGSLAWSPSAIMPTCRLISASSVSRCVGIATPTFPFVVKPWLLTRSALRIALHLSAQNFGPHSLLRRCDVPVASSAPRITEVACTAGDGHVERACSAHPERLHRQRATLEFYRDQALRREFFAIDVNDLARP